MIEVANVAKRFGAFTALEGITLSVADGMVYGLVGYNGAGKTTLLKIMPACTSLMPAKCTSTACPCIATG